MIAEYKMKMTVTTANTWHEWQNTTPHHTTHNTQHTTQTLMSTHTHITNLGIPLTVSKAGKSRSPNSFAFSKNTASPENSNAASSPPSSLIVVYYVMLCYVMLCHVMSCDVMSRHVMSRHVM